MASCWVSQRECNYRSRRDADENKMRRARDEKANAKEAKSSLELRDGILQARSLATFRVLPFEYVRLASSLLVSPSFLLSRSFRAKSFY